MDAEHIGKRSQMLKDRLTREIRGTLDRISRGNEDPPESLQYFMDVFGNWDVPAATNPATPVVGTSCMQVPLELILACGAVPLRLCNGSHALEQAGSEFLPAKTCALVRATMGMVDLFRERLQKRLALVVVPTTCDAKRKAVEAIGEGTFAVHALEVPPSKETEEAEDYWRNAVKKLILALEKATGRRLTRKRLAVACDRVRLASERFRQLSRFQRNDPPLISGAEMFLVMNAFLLDDLDRWSNAVGQLNLELEKRKTNGRFLTSDPVRILLAGAPPMAPGLKLPLLIEEAGAVIVADEVCSGTRLLYDTTVAGEGRLYDMIPAVADRYLKPCTCPIFDSSRDIRRKLLESAKRSAADGVIYQSFSGCQLYQMEQRGVGQTFRKANLPVLFVETDYSPEDRGQLTTRIEAFVESVRSRKRRQ